jgi:predicted acetyltransferase
MNQSFSRGRIPEPPGDTPEPGSTTFGLFDGGALRAAYTLCDFHAHWGGDLVLALGGIAGVGSFAEARGRGHVGELLRHSFVEQRERGQFVSALYPFAWAFYRRFGYDWVGERRRVTLPLRHVRAAPEGRNVREIPAGEARPVLEPVYTASARNYRGVFDAATHRWHDLLAHNDGRTTYVYVHQSPGSDGPDGYLLWRYPGSGDTGQVRELVANSPAAYRGLLSLLHYFETQVSKASVGLPTDDPLWSHVMHWDLETKVSPVFMGRVVDVVGALNALGTRPGVPDGAATFTVRDEHALWNDGTFHVTCEAGNVTCSRAENGSTPGLVFDIQAFSQAFWGTPTLESLRRTGRVEVGDESSASWLGRLLAGPPVWTLDDF